VKRNNVLGAVCGLLCPTCTLCQEGCVAAGLGEPIDIGKLQYFAVEHAWNIGFAPLRRGAPNGKRVAVIGAGPSGLSCAAELAQRGFAVVVFERLDRPGGILAHVLPEHRCPADVLEREIAEIVALGVEIRCGESIASDADLERLLAEGFSAVFVGTGAWTSERLGVPGSDSEAVMDGMTFLRRMRRDRDASSPRVAGRRVAIIGGGDTAMDAAVTAATAGARDVYLFYRRSFAQMPADEEERMRAIHAGVHFVILTQPLAYLTESEGLRAIRVVRTELGEPDASGRRRPEPIAGSEHELAVDLVVEAIGQVPDPKVRQLGASLFGPGDLIQITKETGATPVRRVYAGGDAVRGPALITHAVGDGKRAAAAIAQALQNEVTS
jgi:NADPH-dependent glutamate synthase beta subunit-like oxidoreductase